MPFEMQLMVTERVTDIMLEQFVDVTKGPNGEPGVVIVHVEARNTFTASYAAFVNWVDHRPWR